MSGGPRRLAATLAIVLFASPALADRKPPSEKDKQLAGELVKRAIARSKAGDHEGAISIYQQAYATVASSALLSNIGSEYQQVGKPKEALRFFCMYLEKDPVGANAPYAIAQAKLLQSQITNRTVDDADLCVTPRTEDVEPKPPSEPVAPRVEPRVEPPIQPPSGVAPVPHRSPLIYAAVGAGAAGLVATGLGLYYGVQAQNISDEITNHPVGEKWVTIRDLQARGQRQENLQIGFLVAGGVLATTGVVLFMLGRSSDSSSEQPDKAAVRVVPTHNGVAVLGRF